MANSSTVGSGDDVLATQYNNLRKDVLDVTTGHDHTGAADEGKTIDHGDLDGLADDDHAQYQKESERGAASGYASLDASTKVVEQPATLTDFISDAAYGAGWNGVTTIAPSKNAVYDGIQAAIAIGEFAVGPIYGTGTPGFQTTRWGYKLDAGGEDVGFVFYVPADFTSLTACGVVFGITGQGTIDWTVATIFAADSENFLSHTDSDTADGITTNNATVKEIDISAALTGLAAGDYVEVKFTLDALTDTSNIFVFSLRFKYS